MTVHLVANSGVSFSVCLHAVMWSLLNKMHRLGFLSRLFHMRALGEGTP